MDSSESRSVWQSWWIRGIAAGLVSLGVAFLGVILAVRLLCDAEYLETHINRALEGTPASAYRVDLGAVRWGVWLGSLRVKRVTMSPDSAAVDSASPVGKSPLRVRGSAPQVSLEGIHLWPILWGRPVEVRTVGIQRPRVRLWGLEETGRSPGGQEASDDSSSASSPARSGFGPPVSVGRIEVRDGTVSAKRAGPRALPPDSLWGLSGTLDPDSLAFPAGLDVEQLLDGRARLAFEGYRRVFADSLYALRLGPGRAETSDSTLRVDAIRFAPTVSDSVFMQRHEVRTNRYHLEVSRVAAQGVDYRRFLENGGLFAEAVRLEAGTLDVYRDNHRPSLPEEPPAPMPYDAVQALDRSLRIDTVRVLDSDIRYAKRKEEVPEAGSISFEDLWATVYNLTNDPRRMGRSSPLVVDARTDVAGTGRLHTTIRLPLLTAGPTLSYEGRLGAMDARAFNETFVNLAGVRIEQGTVDSLWFEAEVSDGVATGSVQGIYRNLEIETLDPTTGDRGLKNRLKTLIVNGLGVRSHSLPGEGPLRTGTIQYEHEEETSFFKFLWKALRSGIYSLVGLDRLPR